MESLVLIGFRGVGKTTLGRFLAESFGRSFYDLDDLVCTEYEKKTQKKLPCGQIFEKLGPTLYQCLEYDTLRSLKMKPGSILSSGGGTVLNPKSRAVIQFLGTIVYLKCDHKSLIDRNLLKGLPSFLTLENFEETLAFRIPIYKEFSEVVYDLQNWNEEDILIKFKDFFEKDVAHAKQ